MDRRQSNEKAPVMTAIDQARELEPPLLSPAEKDLARAAQRCIMAALDHSRAASIITVYLPALTGTPLSSLPSHLSVYFPALRVALGEAAGGAGEEGGGGEVVR